MHGLGKVAHGARVGDVAFLGHVRHQQVIAHQPFDGVGFILFKPKARRDLAHHLCAENGVIFGVALGDVVQQQRHIEHPPIDPVFQDRRGDGQVLDQFALFDHGQLRDALDDVFVHRVRVVHIELHHRHDVFEFGNKRGQYAQFVHPTQRPFRIAVFQHQI